MTKIAHENLKHIPVTLAHIRGSHQESNTSIPVRLNRLADELATQQQATLDDISIHRRGHWKPLPSVDSEKMCITRDSNT
jgi:hypothetical protein